MSKEMRKIRAIRAAFSSMYIPSTIWLMYRGARNPLVSGGVWVAVTICIIIAWTLIQNEFKEEISKQKSRDRAAARRRKAKKEANIVPITTLTSKE